MHITKPGSQADARTKYISRSRQNPLASGLHTSSLGSTQRAVEQRKRTHLGKDTTASAAGAKAAAPNVMCSMLIENTSFQTGSPLGARGACFLWQSGDTNWPDHKILAYFPLPQVVLCTSNFLCTIIVAFEGDTQPQLVAVTAPMSIPRLARSLHGALTAHPPVSQLRRFSPSLAPRTCPPQAQTHTSTTVVPTIRRNTTDDMAAPGEKAEPKSFARRDKLREFEIKVQVR